MFCVFFDFFLIFCSSFFFFLFFNNKNQLTNFSIYYYVCINTYRFFFFSFFSFSRVGATCAEQLCPGCYGKCTDGTCQCGPTIEGYERHHGKDCALVDCIEPTCGGHGSCNRYANASDDGGR